MLKLLDLRIQAGLRRPLRGPILYESLEIYPRTKALWFRYKKTGVWKHGADRIPYPKKPDVDNAMKPELDAATEAGVLEEDSRVFVGKIYQFYQHVDEDPGIYFCFTEIVDG